jgi:FkbM family methyltransferase
MDSPRISVCICTHEGAGRIADTLWSLARQSAPADSYEIVVVDNRSSDHAALRTLVNTFEDLPVDISLAVEPNLGLSHARNRALEASRGEYLFFIDDDAQASPRLIERYLDAISEHRPDVIGGNVHPIFEQAPPPELDYRYWSRWSLKLFGDEDRWLEEGEYFIGTNMGASRELLENEGFDPELGRKGSSLAGCEDWFLGESRFQRRFVAGADVFHKVPPDRLSTEYLARRNADLRLQLESLRRAGRPITPPRTGGGWDETGNPIVRELRLLARKLWRQLSLRLAEHRRLHSHGARVPGIEMIDTKRIKRALPPVLRRRIREFLYGPTIDEVEIVHRFLCDEGLQSEVPERVMLDVGAHHGAALEGFARDGWRVLGFEPDTDNRAVLEGFCRRFPNVEIDPRALAQRIEGERPWFRSDLSSGISSLEAFHESHEPSGCVEVTTLAQAMEEHKVERVDFLKIDAEGTDLFVLQGMPWEWIRPAVVVCEFEDQKTRPLGYDFHALADYLVDKGYLVLVSEWYPIAAYGARHRWRRFASYPCELVNPRAWGNLIAVRSAAELARLTALAKDSAPR